MRQYVIDETDWAFARYAIVQVVRHGDWDSDQLIRVAEIYHRLTNTKPEPASAPADLEEQANDQKNKI